MKGPIAGLALLIVAAGCSPSAALYTPERAAAPRADADLQRAVELVAQGFSGVVGVYVRHLPSGRTAELRADTLFPTASMIKVPILVATFDRIERGELSYTEDLVFRDSLRYSEDDLFGELRDSATVPLHEAVEMMLSLSDNTASLWLQQLSGGGEQINRWLSANGFAGTRMNSRTPGRRPIWEVYGWGVTTPREMSELMRRIVEGEAVSPAADDEMHRALTRTFYDDEAVSEMPPWVQTATKQGAVNQSRSEVVYVHAPSGPYVFCVITKDQADQSWTPENEGYRIIRAYTRLFWQTFEPKSTWRPVEGYERFRL